MGEARRGNPKSLPPFLVGDDAHIVPLSMMGDSEKASENRLGCMSFSCPGKKRTKRTRLKGRCVSRSRAPKPPLSEYPGPPCFAAEDLNLPPEHSKNVPIFAVLAGSVQNRRFLLQRTATQLPRIPRRGRLRHIGPFADNANSPTMDNHCRFSLWGDVGIAPYDAEKLTFLTL